jgi:hypothetical protein
MQRGRLLVPANSALISYGGPRLIRRQFSEFEHLCEVINEHGSGIDGARRLLEIVKDLKSGEGSDLVRCGTPSRDEKPTRNITSSIEIDSSTTTNLHAQSLCRGRSIFRNAKRSKIMTLRVVVLTISMSGWGLAAGINTCTRPNKSHTPPREAYSNSSILPKDASYCSVSLCHSLHGIERQQ